MLWLKALLSCSDCRCDSVWLTIRHWCSGPAMSKQEGSPWQDPHGEGKSSGASIAIRGLESKHVRVAVDGSHANDMAGDGDTFTVQKDTGKVHAKYKNAQHGSELDGELEKIVWDGFDPCDAGRVRSGAQLKRRRRKRKHMKQQILQMMRETGWS